MRLKENEILGLFGVNREYRIIDIVKKIHDKPLKIISPEYVYISKKLIKMYKNKLVEKRFGGRYVFYKKRM